MLVLFNVFVASDAVRGEGLLWLLLVFFIVVVVAVLHTAAVLIPMIMITTTELIALLILSYFLYNFFAAVLSQWDSSHGKFGLLFTGKASCDRVALPNLRCMLSVMVFP